VSNAYQGVIQAAKDSGFVFNTGRSVWSATILMIPFAAFQLIYPAWCVHQAGEIKRGNSLRAQMFQIVGAEIFSIILVVIIAAVSISSVGREFIASAGHLFNEGQLIPNVPPIFGFFAGMTTQNPLLLLIIMGTFSFWFWMWCPNITLGASRVLLAMSFDRVLPSYVGEVNSRTHTPVNAIVLVSIAGIIIGILYSYTGFWKLTLALALYNIGCFGVTNLAGALMPYVRPNTWKTSPAKDSTILGIPIITICGIIFFAFAVWCIYKYLFDSLYGINDPLSLVFILVLYGVSALIFFVSKWYRRKEGLDLGKIYEEIPVE
jgi:amino acid transporter